MVSILYLSQVSEQSVLRKAIMVVHLYVIRRRSGVSDNSLGSHDNANLNLPTIVCATIITYPTVLVQLVNGIFKRRERVHTVGLHAV